MTRRGIKPLVMAKLKENIPKLREGKPIFLRVVDGSLTFNTLRSYVYECMNDLRFGDHTLPNVSTKEVIYEGHRSIEIIPRVGTAIAMHDLRSGLVPFSQPSADIAAGAIATMAAQIDSPVTNNRAAWLSACISEAIDMVALIDHIKGIPEFEPRSPEGEALIKELRAKQ
jgi:hypothetical protein